MSDALEESLDAQLDFDKVAKIGRAGHQVVPVVIQDADSGEGGDRRRQVGQNFGPHRHNSVAVCEFLELFE